MKNNRRGFFFFKDNEINERTVFTLCSENTIRNKH